MPTALDQENEFDCIIVGGGPSGAACAAALLKQHDVSVALVDRSKFPRDKACGDGIGPGVVSVMTELGLADVLEKHVRVENVAVSSPNGTRVSGHLPNIGGVAATGFVIPRTVFDNYIFQAAIQRGAHDYSGFSFEEATFDTTSQSWRVVLASGDRKEHTITIRSRVLVGADGASSRVRRLLGYQLNPPKYTGAGLRSYVSNQALKEPALRLDFVGSLLPAYGWVFPIDGSNFNIGVGIDADRFKERGQSLESLLAQYCKHLGDDLETDKNTFSSHPLPYGINMPPLADTARPAALIGDAASMINPLTGEGIFYGMYAGTLLATQIAGRFRDAGQLKIGLRAYERQFLHKFREHFRLNWRMKEKVSIPQFCNMVIRATSKDTKILDELVELMMGDRRRISTRMMLKIGVKGIF